MTRNALFILLAAIVAVGASSLCGAMETPEDWRTDYRRPDGRFGDRAPGMVDAWRADHRRPDGLLEGGAASTVEWWNRDARRPAAVPLRDTDRNMVQWWRVDSRRPAWFPRGTMMASTVDSDGDGVLDDVDRCPGTPKGATVDARGCPMDSDGDGVYDGIDQCPDTPPGVEVDARGCTVVTSEKEAQLLDTGTLRLENVYFDTNKATLKSESYAALDEAGGILVKWPQLRIEVAGHTDSVGEDAYNQDLSQRRAQSVLDYLLGNFSLKAAQFSVKGYGEDDPVADNGTSDGRGQNRRVELRVLNRDVLRKN